MTDNTLTPVFIEESFERWGTFFLSDGSVLRMKLVPNTIHRIDGQYDAFGNPLYNINIGLAVVYEKVPEELKATKQ
jgi:hypothetical protein